MSILKWPFYPDTITDILGPELDKQSIAKEILSYFQVGCAINLMRAVAIIGFDTIRLNNYNYEDVKNRIAMTGWQFFNYAKFCEYFRHGKDISTNRIFCLNGDQRCKDWDFYKAQEILRKVKKENLSGYVEVFQCHLKIYDIVSVIYIASRPVGVLYSGQFVKKERKSEIRKEILAAIECLDKDFQNPNIILPKVVLNNDIRSHLVSLINELEEKNEEQQSQLESQMKKEAYNIGRIAEEYWLRYKKSQEEIFLNELRKIKIVYDSIKERDPITEYIQKFIEKVCGFLEVKWLLFFADWEGEGNILDLIAYAGFNDELKDAQLHFNWNKSRIEMNEIPELMENNIEFVQRGLRQRNSRIPDQTKKFEDCKYIIPQIRGTHNEKTMIIFGPFIDEHNINDERRFLIEISNMLSDIFRHENRYVNLVIREEQWADIAALIAHQVRNVLQPIQSGFRILIKSINGEKELSDEKLNKYERNIYSNIRHLAEHSKITLASAREMLSKLGRYKSTDYNEINLSSLISDLIDGYMEEANSSNIELRKGKGIHRGIMGEIVQDPFSTAIRNILDNGLKYSRPNSYMIVDILIDEHIQAWANFATITIQNVGYGIFPKDRELIFKKGKQGENRGNQVGDGLGLFEAKKIIQGHKGIITFESDKRTPNSGLTDWVTIFHIKIPLYRVKNS